MAVVGRVRGASGDAERVTVFCALCPARPSFDFKSKRTPSFCRFTEVIGMDYELKLKLTTKPGLAPFGSEVCAWMVS